jgi:polar amino acid transport system substrate-binding protein
MKVKYGSFTLNGLFLVLVTGLMWAGDINDTHAEAIFASPLPDTINIYTSHDSPPYILNHKSRTGLLFDVVSGLQAEAPALTFSEHVITRPEINTLLKANQPAMVMWVNPSWLSDIPGPLYWSDPLFETKNMFVSLKERGLRYETLEDVKGLVFGARVGYGYHAVDILKGPEPIKRIESNSDEENIAHLLSGKVDFIILPKALGLYYFKSMNLAGKIEASDTPGQAYTVYIMVTPHYLELLPVINRVIKNLDQSDAWQSKLNFYGLVGSSIESH